MFSFKTAKEDNGWRYLLYYDLKLFYISSDNLFISEEVASEIAAEHIRIRNNSIPVVGVPRVFLQESPSHA